MRKYQINTIQRAFYKITSQYSPKVSRLKKLVMVVHTCNPAIREAEAGLQIQVQPGQLS
jgi:hypothetical protein